MSTHFGDLMGGSNNTQVVDNGLTTTASSSSHLLQFTPLERILITANGNLQRIVSSYHAKVVDVQVVYNNQTTEKGVFSRQVTLHLDHAPRPFCTATSLVTVTNEAMLTAISSNSIGIGQLFRHFDTLPVFTLHSVQRGTCTNPKNTVEQDAVPTSKKNNEDTSFWRLYQLEAAGGITCRILEQFEGNVLDLKGT